MSEMSDDEAARILRGFAEGKANVHTFFTKIIKTKDTTRVGNLTIDELGMSKLPVRTYKELALFSKDVYGDSSWEDFFNNMSEIQTSTSLSKEAILLKLSVTNKKELADVTPTEKKENKGWFKSKDKN